MPHNTGHATVFTITALFIAACGPPPLNTQTRMAAADNNCAERTAFMPYKNCMEARLTTYKRGTDNQFAAKFRRKAEALENRIAVGELSDSQGRTRLATFLDEMVESAGGMAPATPPHLDQHPNTR